MGLQQMLEEHVNKPHKRNLEMEAEHLDTAIKKFDEVLELADDDRMGYFLDIIKRKKDKVEVTLLDPETPDNIRNQCIGEMRSLKAIYNWKQYYLTALTQAKSDIAQIKEELKTGERPDDHPND